MDTNRGIFIVAFSVLAVVVMSAAAMIDPTVAPWQWFLLCGSTNGLSRIISKEKIGQPVRDWAEGSAFQELVNCPRCIGVWIATLLLALLLVAPDASLVPLIVFSISGVNIIVQEVLGIFCRITTMCDKHIACTKENL